MSNRMRITGSLPGWWIANAAARASGGGKIQPPRVTARDFFENASERACVYKRSKSIRKQGLQILPVKLGEVSKRLASLFISSAFVGK